MREFQIRSNAIVTPSGIRSGFVQVRGDKIVSVMDKAARGIEIHDLSDLTVSPGIVDTHAHLNEPGRTEWEGFETATRAAAAAGVTTVVDMPLNCIPPTTTKRAFEEKAAAASSKASVDYGFWGGVVPSNLDELDNLMNAGVCGFKAFLIDSGVEEFPPCTADDLKAPMKVLSRRRFPLLVHAELQGEGPILSQTNRYRDFLASRPAEWEVSAIALIIELSRKTVCPVHIVHLSAATAIPIIQSAKQSGVQITVETCPHYLAFRAEDVPTGATLFKCTPPIREGENLEALWRAVLRGEIDCIVSDHSPCVPKLKGLEKGDFQSAWGGIAGLQIAPAATWTFGSSRGLSHNLFSRLSSQNPAILAGLLGKGAILPGYDADFRVWDPDREFTVQSLLHRHPESPYLGMRLKGEVVRTYLRGEIIFDEGRFAEGRGRLLIRGES